MGTLHAIYSVKYLINPFYQTVLFIWHLLCTDTIYVLVQKTIYFYFTNKDFMLKQKGVRGKVFINDAMFRWNNNVAKWTQHAEVLFFSKVGFKKSRSFSLGLSEQGPLRAWPGTLLYDIHVATFSLGIAPVKCCHFANSSALADLEGACPAHTPPRVPDSFILTYKIFEMKLPRESTRPLRGPHPPTENPGSATDQYYVISKNASHYLTLLPFQYFTNNNHCVN